MILEEYFEHIGFVNIPHIWYTTTIMLDIKNGSRRTSTGNAGNYFAVNMVNGGKLKAHGTGNTG